ncbi:MAG: bis(5'-nucleosyl)-tetraphosphatase (symmetrical) YqeK [Bacilli bacterium]
MKSIEKIIYNKFKNKEDGIKRYNHSLGVYKEAKKLVEFYNFDIDLDKLKIATLLHDYAKFETLDTFKKIIIDEGLEEIDLLKNQKLLHSILGPYLIKKDLNVLDEEILNAVRFHTTGRANMSLLEELVFLADYIEENRKGQLFEELRKTAYTDFKKAIALEFEYLIKKLMAKNETIDNNTIEGYNFSKKHL